MLSICLLDKLKLALGITNSTQCNQNVWTTFTNQFWRMAPFALLKTFNTSSGYTQTALIINVSVQKANTNWKSNYGREEYAAFPIISSGLYLVCAWVCAILFFSSFFSFFLRKENATRFVVARTVTFYIWWRLRSRSILFWWESRFF